MKNILLAIGHKETEDMLKKNLIEEEFKVVGVVTYKGGIIKSTEFLRPDIIILRENIIGNENIIDIVYEIRALYPSIRIIILLDDNDTDNGKFNILASYGVYDILQGKTVKLIDIINLVKTPRTLKDISKHSISNLPFSYTSKEVKPTVELPDVKEKKGFLNLGIKHQKTDKVIKDVIEPFEKELSNKETILANTEKEIKILKETISQKEKKINEIKGKIIPLNDNKDQLERELLQLKVSCESINSEVDALNIKKKENEEKYLKQKNIKIELEKEFLLKTTEIESLNFQINELKEKEISEEETLKLINEKDTLENSIIEANEDLSKLKKTIEEKAKALEEIKIEQERCKIDEVNIDKRYEKIKEEIADEIEIKIKGKEATDKNFLENKKRLEEINKEIINIEAELVKLEEEKEIALNKKNEFLNNQNLLIEKTKLISEEADNLIKEVGKLSEKVISDTDLLSKLKTDIETGSFYIEGSFNVADPKLAHLRNSVTDGKDTFLENKKVRVKISQRTSNRCQLVSFLGSKPGVGNSTIALNISAALAEKYKVLYVETNDKYPCTSYLYELDNINKGLEFALKHAISGENNKIYEHILTSNNENVPKNINFLTFSQSYLVNEKSEDAEFLSANNLKTLLRELKADNQYDYIIADVKSDDSGIFNAFLNNSMYTDIMFIVLNQDVYSINCAYNKKEQIAFNEIEFEDKVYYIVNKYDNHCKLKIADIIAWLEVDPKKIITISLDFATLSDLSIDGGFYSLQKGKSYNFTNTISEILAI